MYWAMKEYQRTAVNFLLAHPRSGLFLDMGLGKTAVSLTAAKVLIDRDLISRILVIAPHQTLRSVWPAEIEKWDHLRGLTYYNLHANPIPDGGKWPRANIIGINPESALRYMRSGDLFSQGFDLLILDESSTFKNDDSQRFKLIKPNIHLFPRRWILTGTPASNGLEGLWAQMYIVDRGESLGKYITHFRTNYLTPNWNGFGYAVNADSKNKIFRAIAPKILRMSAKDHLDMPELVINKIPVTLDSKSFATYKSMEKEYLAIIKEETVISVNAGVAGMKCRQIANGGVYNEDGEPLHVHNAKVHALRDIVDQLQGNPLLVFYEFRHDIRRIREVLGDVPNLTGAKDAEKLIEAFNAGDIPVLVGHPATIGIGLNLQACCHNLCWVGIPWDLQAFNQANARVWRQGQEADRVIVHLIMAVDTLDSTVMSALQKKEATQQELFDAIKALNSTADL